ncbi:MAG: hypothetical protein ABS35_15990 [Kaistia sp. SCN 65-12]|nr:MAG: hypothetical protein ABS35_15990 [Kaistia sp. SCN 65-12]
MSSKQGLAAALRVEMDLLQRRHELQALDMGRQVKALAAVEARERKALEEKRLREQRIVDRAGHEHMPVLSLDLKPKGRGASVRRAKDRYRDRLKRTQCAPRFSRVSSSCYHRRSTSARRTGRRWRGRSRGAIRSIWRVILRGRRGTLAAMVVTAAMTGCRHRGLRGRRDGERARARRRWRDDDFDRER